jgi:hypothetical protein
MKTFRGLSDLSRRQFMKISGLLNGLWLTSGRRESTPSYAARRTSGEIYIADLENCEPQAALSRSRQAGSWRLIPFQSENARGNMLSATSRTNPPNLSYSLQRSGWYAIFVGLYDPGVEGEKFLLRLKLSGDRHFTKMQPEGLGGFQHLEEAFWRVADLTGQDLWIAVQPTGLGYFAQLAYLRLVPLSEAEVEDYRQSLPNPETRTLVAQNDGHGNFYGYAPQSAADLEEQLEVFRNTDFGALYWATGSHGAGLVNFPSQVSAHFGQKVDDYGRLGDQLYAQCLRKLLDQGVDPLRVVVDYAHSLGLEIHITQRLTMAIWPPMDDLMVPFFVEHPEWRCRDRDGVSIIRMSLAYPQVREWFLKQYSEVASYGIDGVGVQLNRRPPVVLFEEPVLQEFREKYSGLDPRDLSDTDPRLLSHWAGYVSQFFRELRQQMNRFRRPDGRPLAITVNVLGDESKCRAGGLDPETWIQEGLVDVLIPYDNPGDITWSSSIDTEYFSSITRGTRCRFVHDLMPRSMPGQAYALRAARAYHEGADQLAFWDTNARDLLPSQWDTIRQLGHRDRLPQLIANSARARTIRLKTVFGYSVERRYI